ncbi:MAG TPA: endonuclease [Kosmotogaceae bacterium]|nr:MAG: HhH-GPD family protein [Thermotogales bacterium 46_20]HAA85179.1 endonuclease [Kosmotogaceae bacterium]
MEMNLLKIYELLFEEHGPQEWWPADTPFEVAVGAILTQNTSWLNVEAAIDQMKEAEMLDAKKLAEESTEVIGHLIKPAGFWKAKAGAIKSIAKLFSENSFSEGRNAPGRNRLLAIKGVGNETADAILLYAFGENVFVVDKYTRRLLTRLGMNPPEGYRALQDIFVRSLPDDVELYGEYHALIVKHSKAVCKSTPSCSDCCLRSYCNRNT